MTDARKLLPRVARPGRPKRHVEALFLSDLHLGTLGCKSLRLLDFLDRHEAGTIFLVGDILDTWRPMGANWKPAHHDVLRLLADRATAGARIVYVPGNHDSFFRHHLGANFFNFEILRETEYTAADGTRFLVTHGDCCDVFSQNRLAALSKAGSWLETGVRRLGQGINLAREKLGRGGWDGLETALARVNTAIRARDRYEERLAALARSRGFDGIICGHFHQPALHSDFGVVYANCGDWVENCTALVATARGLELIRWDEPAPALTSDRAAALS